MFEGRSDFQRIVKLGILGKKISHYKFDAQVRLFSVFYLKLH